MTELNIKRAYEPASPDDGFRIYIDRLWPRGLSHETFPYNLWDKDIAPSTDLREWFHVDPAGRWSEFRNKYLEELKNNASTPALVKLVASKPVVTLLYSSHDPTHNNAVVVLDYLSEMLHAE